MSFFRYPGGKSKLKKIILSRLHQYSREEYREPFFGGGGVGSSFLAEQSPSSIWINDKDIGISCLWTSVINHPDELKQKVMQFTPSTPTFYLHKNELLNLTTTPEHIDEVVYYGFIKLAIHQTSYSGLGTKSGGPLGGKEQKSKYKIDCRWSPSYICKKIDKLHKQLSAFAVKNKKCTNCDFEDLIRASGDALLYLDPPYYKKGNDLYQCGFTQQDHERLALSLRESEHDWVLSYDDCDEIRTLYEWANIEEINVNYTITATKEKCGKRLSRTKPELIISK